LGVKLRSVGVIERAAKIKFQMSEVMFKKKDRDVVGRRQGDFGGGTSRSGLPSPGDGFEMQN